MSVTLKDLASETGFAVSTISNVLNNQATCFASDETRLRIQEAARKLGYRPHYLARGLRHQRTFTIGVVGSPFGSEVAAKTMQGIGVGLRTHGYMALYGDSYGVADRELDVARELEHRQVDGLLVITRGRCDYAAELQLPTVFVTDPAVPNVPGIFVDRAAAFEQMVDHLVSHGHRRIGMALPAIEANESKAEGYRSGLRRHGIGEGELILEGGGKPGNIMDAIRHQPDYFSRYTAIIASSDQAAREVIAGLELLGRRVPEDCSVTGFDDSSFALSGNPSLTTLHFPMEDVAGHSVAMLMNLLQDKPAESLRLVPMLIERESVAAPPPTTEGINR